MLGEIISAGANLLGGILGGNRADAAAEKQAALQREFAQTGIQWKVADAKKAGISPYYALGANTASYSPVSVGDGGIGKGLSDASQDLGRAAAASMTKSDRDDTSKQAVGLQLENQHLQNELLKTQIARQRAQLGPPMPALNQKVLIDGQPATEVATPSGASVKRDDIKQQPDTVPKHNRIRVGGIKLYTNPYFSDAEDIETRYGDAAEEIGGMANFAGDLYHTGKHYWTRYNPEIMGFIKKGWRPSYSWGDR